MKEKLEKQLFKKYPGLFHQARKSPFESPMGRGIECGDGGYDLIDRMCSLLQWDIRHNGEGHIEFAQMKQKSGSLTVYADNLSDYQEGVPAMAAQISKRICEECGSTDQVKSPDEYWIKYVCAECRNRQETSDNDVQTPDNRQESAE